MTKKAQTRNPPQANASEADKGLRYNTGKLRFDLMPWEWPRVIVAILTDGATKYAPRNWEKGLSWSDTMASMERHIDAFKRGEFYDSESGHPHLGHVAWNALALMSMYLRNFGTNDMPQYRLNAPMSVDPAEAEKMNRR